MLTTAANRGAPDKRASGVKTRRVRGTQPRRGRATSSTPADDDVQEGDSTDAGGITASAARRLRIRRGDEQQDATATDQPAGGASSRSSRRALVAATGNDGDPDDRLQMTLDLSEPEPRGYKPSARPPRERMDTTRWLWLAMGSGAATCPILLGFQLVFTNPAHGANVLAVVVTMAFGALFATWTFEYWFRRGTAAKPATPPIWALTRHAILAFMGVATMAVSALNGTASFGLLLLVIFTLIAADIVLRRVRIR